ncbi:hypothetical protein [Zavarzinia sp.]|uniref:hypothetical protein n=1 Tax=Zavarzinia sp. TaxID=2027920 RepID=UPI003563011E
MTVLRLFALRAEAALFDSVAARVAWAVLGAALGLWQGPLFMIGLTAALVVLNALLGAIGSLPASPRNARAVASRAPLMARPQGA